MRILNVFKILVPAVLSCSFLTALGDTNTELAFLGLDAAQFTPPSANATSVQQGNMTQQQDNQTNNNSNVVADSVWTNMSRQFKLDHYAELSQVQAEIHKIQQDPQDFYHTLEAAGPYIYYILQQTQQHGLPAELALLPVIESAYNPYDREKTGATGLWQLMPQTASDLGIKVNHTYDGRMSVIDSTKAALSYLQTLGNHFKGNWSLALAAYNWGPGNIDSAERKSGSNSFWQLHMPQETTRYVPKLLAVAEVVEHPDKYGIKLPPVSNAPYFTEVKVNKPINLTQLAKSIGFNVASLVHLNSAYQQPSSTLANNTVLVPVDKAQSIQTTLVATGIVKSNTTLLAMNNQPSSVTANTSSSDNSSAYVVQAGEDLQQIANLFHVSVQAIMSANNLTQAKVYPGQKLIIPAEDAHLA